jgi:hypothetical protein
MPPIDVPCRWDEDIDLIKAYNGAYIAILNGREVTLSATIMFPLNYTLREEGYVALGKTTDYPSDVLLDPKNVPNAREIIKLQRIPFLGANGEHPEEIFKMVYV